MYEGHWVNMSWLGVERLPRKLLVNKKNISTIFYLSGNATENTQKTNNKSMMKLKSRRLELNNIILRKILKNSCIHFFRNEIRFNECLKNFFLFGASKSKLKTVIKLPLYDKINFHQSSIMKNNTFSGWKEKNWNLSPRNLIEFFCNHTKESLTIMIQNLFTLSSIFNFFSSLASRDKKNVPQPYSHGYKRGTRTRV